MTQVTLDIDGPDFYCPDCGRWLARAHPDRGTFDLAAKASVSLIAEVEMDPDAEEVVAPTLMAEAVCHRLLCRFRRWLRGYHR